MQNIEEVDVDFLWSLNGDRTWVKHLLACYHSKVGRDYDTIAFWRSNFFFDVETVLTCDRDYIVTDGHHRLVAAHLNGRSTVTVRVCPQKTTYR